MIFWTIVRFFTKKAISFTKQIRCPSHTVEMLIVVIKNNWGIKLFLSIFEDRFFGKFTKDINFKQAYVQCIPIIDHFGNPVLRIIAWLIKRSSNISQ
ncbi:unnamed protein product [Meloidogyne enterolobii]|uniref:Uncharacterized protein n=1 Tax=Meloidogyne enterolobii TaxID=390850 RepID=A0ACB1AH84_MELEN